MIHHVLPAFRRNGSKLITLFEELWLALESIIRDSSTEKIICILDALDECSDAPKEIESSLSEPQAEERKKLLRKLAATASSSTSLKIILTSRPYGVIETALFYQTGLDKNHVHLTGDDEAERAFIEEEIGLVIMSKVDDFRERRIGEGIHDCAHETLQSRLDSIENRTYLWVSAIFNKLEAEAGAPESELNAIIRTLPEDVDTAYENIFIQTSRGKQHILRRVLHFMLAAFEPLSLQQMKVALNIADKGVYSKNDQLLPDDSFKKWIRNLCGFFINVVKGKLYFVHESAREFLLPKYSQGVRGWRGGFEPVESHALLARACLDRLHSLSNNTSDKLTGFEKYAVRFWVVHFQEVKENDVLRHCAQTFMLIEEVTDSFTKWMRRFKQSTSSSFGYLRYYFRNDYWGELISEPPSPFFLACHYGWMWLINQLTLSKDFDWYQTNVRGDTGFTVASRYGQLEVVDLLIARVIIKGFNFGQYFSPPLEAAAEKGHTNIVQTLLNAGADVNYVAEGQEHTALTAAASQGHLNPLEKLLAAGADVDAAPAIYRGKTALQAAAEKGHLAVIEKLLTAGADINAAPANYGGRTALQRAAKNGFTDVVEKLLAWGADVNAPAAAEAGNMALEAAVKRCHIEASEKLLAAGADINLALARIDSDEYVTQWGDDDDDRTSKSRRVEFVQKLREAGAKERYLPPKYRIRSEGTESSEDEVN